jgi:hypothetical protein
MMGPDLWRRFLKDPLSQIISAARAENSSVQILYLSFPEIISLPALDGSWLS